MLSLPEGHAGRSGRPVSPQPRPDEQQFLTGGQRRGLCSLNGLADWTSASRVCLPHCLTDFGVLKMVGSIGLTMNILWQGCHDDAPALCDSGAFWHNAGG